MTRKEIRPTLAVHMADQGFTPTTLANRAGLSSDVIKKAKRGGKISRKTADLICKALGIDPDDIVDLNY